MQTALTMKRVVLVSCLVSTQIVAQTPSGGPGARLGHALAYMASADQILLFGGFQPDGQPRADLWTWTGNTWRLLSNSGPSPRRWPAMAFDSRRNRVVMHGGRDGVGGLGRPLDDTWEWNGERWRLISEAGPGGRDHHRIVYDPVRDRMVLFGGWDGARTRAEVWELEGDRWREIGAAGPSARAAHGMTFDAAQGEVVLFGGSADTTFYADTWRWNGRRWAEVDGTGPPARSFHGMVYNPRGNQIVVAGGRRGMHLYNDVWIFEGSRWRQIEAMAPSARYVYDLAYHDSRQELMFHGGGYIRDGRWTLFDETWVFRSAEWVRR